MCGIAGLISKTNQVDVKQTIWAMSQAIKHRGPDGEGFTFFSSSQTIPAYSKETPSINKGQTTFLFNPSRFIADVEGEFKLAFAHRRLSIIDLSESGHQPMCDLQGDYWITFNGEVFNYIELREQLKQKGHVFITQTDTEVVIASYKEWGVECLQKFNGMFAFALFDKKAQRLFCARDRVGVKPFYFSNTPQSFAFASEYKAFIKSNLLKFEINEAQQFDFIVNANLETAEQSLFKGINELKPSHYLIYEISTHTFQIKRYYSLPKAALTQKTETENINSIHEKILNSVRLRLRSDVEVGSCLSGGLDSSIIAGIVKYLQPDKSMQLFTAVFPKETFDESHYAKTVANYVGGSWKTITPTAEEFFRDIETLNYFQDLPVWSTSTYAQHRVMKLASENQIKVVLDGQGADEIFAGYSHHYMALWKQQCSFKSFKLINDAHHTMPDAYKVFAKQLVKDVFRLSVDYSRYFVNNKKHFGKSKNDKLASSLNGQLEFDYNGRLKSFLKCEDRCSMAFGIESRVPFADDVELVNEVFSIEGNQKIQHGISKYLLREAAKLYIPNEIYTRKDKIGFETPIKAWLELYKQHILAIIESELDFIDLNYFNTNFDRLLTQKPSFILRLFSFAVWKKAYS